MTVSFNPQSTLVATGSMDTTARLWDIVNGTERATLAVSNDNFIILIINYYL